MNQNVLFYVERTVNVKKADKAIAEAKSCHEKFQAELFKHVIIPFRNTFCYVSEKNMKEHYAMMIEKFESCCANASIEQLKDDLKLDECAAFEKIFGSNIKY